MESQPVAELRERIRSELGNLGEYASLSIDGTFKAVAPLLLQTPSRSKKEVKVAVQKITGVGPEHVCVSVVGIHSRLLALHLATSESSDSYVAAVCEAAPLGMRGETYHISTDNPSQKLARALLTVLPKLAFLPSDPMRFSFSISTAFVVGGNVAGKSRVVYLVRKLASRVLATRWPGAAHWPIGSEVPSCCSRARALSGAPLGKKEESALVKILGGDTTSLVTMGEYVKSLVAI